jgi:transposase-like protein
MVRPTTFVELRHSRNELKQWSERCLNLNSHHCSGERRARVQRCQVRKGQNVLAKVRKKDRKVVAEDLRRVFYAGDSLTAKQALEAFVPR